jgi:transposase-like protein
MEKSKVSKAKVTKSSVVATLTVKDVINALSTFTAEDKAIIKASLNPAQSYSTIVEISDMLETLTMHTNKLQLKGTKSHSSEANKLTVKMKSVLTRLRKENIAKKNSLPRKEKKSTK